MITSYRMQNLQEAVDVATTLSQSWFRGHSRIVGELTPRLFRPEFRDPMVTLFRPDIELQTIEAFKRHAPLLADLEVPLQDDRLGWLSVMQHYRCPTRLLDWTENLLVALYFVVASDQGDNGELWAMLPWALNAASGAGWGVPFPDSPAVRFFVDSPYWNGTVEELVELLKLKGPVESPLALELPLRFARMAVQSSTFTIHPPPDGSRTIQEALPDSKHLVRYIIPAEVKPQLLKQLRHLGVSERHLFPDLEGLSRMIEYDSRTLGYGAPDPPACSGEYVET